MRHPPEDEGKQPGPGAPSGEAGEAFLSDRPTDEGGIAARGQSIEDHRGVGTEVEENLPEGDDNEGSARNRELSSPDDRYRDDVLDSNEP